MTEVFSSPGDDITVRELAGIAVDDSPAKTMLLFKDIRYVKALAGYVGEAVGADGIYLGLKHFDLI